MLMMTADPGSVSLTENTTLLVDHNSFSCLDPSDILNSGHVIRFFMY